MFRLSKTTDYGIVLMAQLASAPDRTPLNARELAQSSDLGLGGMRLWRRCSADDPVLPAHTLVELAFELPGTRELVELRGEVVSDEPQGEGREYRATGVRFFELSPEVQQRLRTFLKDPP